VNTARPTTPTTAYIMIERPSTTQPHSITYEPIRAISTEPS